MDAKDIRVSRGLRLQEVFLCGDAIREELVVDHAVFARRKDVRSEIQIVEIVVNEFEWQHGPVRLPRSFLQRKRDEHGSLLTLDLKSRRVKLCYIYFNASHPSCNSRRGVAGGAFRAARWQPFVRYGSVQLRLL
jgi:hypothetical protein